MFEIKIFPQKIKGKIKPMHAINNCPMRGPNMSAMHYIGEAGIPYSRLHDTGGEYGGTVFVDIDNIFTNPDADENLPESYSFEFTDYLLKNLSEQGCMPFYRLGCSIENYRHIKPLHINPPKDPEKWSRICEHIIMHYNCGWADGYYYNIEYWEIWNEPDNEPDSSENPMWNGTAEQYYNLYTTVANYLKSRFPDIKIGGYASCGFYEILNSCPDTSAHISSRTEYFLEFFVGFLEHISKEKTKAPLDFFSWHSYSGIEENIKYAEYARNMLDKYGFYKTESIFNEWNPGIQYRGTLTDASNIASMMLALHSYPVDMMMYYDGQIDTSYGGMFDPVSKTPFPAYYVFKAFNILYQLGNECQCTCKSTDRICNSELYMLCAVASDSGKGSNNVALMITNASDAERCVNVVLEGYIVSGMLMIDNSHMLEPEIVSEHINLEAHSSAVVLFSPEVL